MRTYQVDYHYVRNGQQRWIRRDDVRTACLEAIEDARTGYCAFVKITVNGYDSFLSLRSCEQWLDRNSTPVNLKGSNIELAMLRFVAKRLQDSAPTPYEVRSTETSEESAAYRYCFEVLDELYRDVNEEPVTPGYTRDRYDETLNRLEDRRVSSVYLPVARQVYDLFYNALYRIYGNLD